LKTFFILLLILIPDLSWAQRGKITGIYPPVPLTPTAGHISFWNSQVLPPKTFLIEGDILTTISLDYGVSETVSMGFSAWPLVSLVTQTFPIIGRIRYRFFSSPQLGSVISASLGRLISGSDHLYTFSSNTTYYASKMDSITGFLSSLRYFQDVNAFSNRLGPKGSLQFQMVLWGLNGEHCFSQTLCTHGIVGAPAQLQVDLDSETASSTMGLTGWPWDIGFFASHVWDFKISEKSLLSLGLTYVEGLAIPFHYIIPYVSYGQFL